MRLIDADVADKWMQQNNAFIDFAILKAIPTIDAVPVVRCRECVHNHPEFVGNETQWCELCRTTINLDDFCSQGQRKTKTVLPKSDAKDESLEADHEVSEQDGRSAIHCCCSK